MNAEDDLRAQIARRQAVAVVGAGVSLTVTEHDPVASWLGLLKNGVKRCEEVVHDLPHGWGERTRADIDSGDIDDLLCAAEKITRKLTSHGGEYRRWLKDTVGGLTVRSGEVVEALKALRVPLVTTNYDGLLEEVTGFDPVTWKDPTRVQQILREDPDEAGIVHLHGYWRDPKSVVLGVSSYEAVVGDAGSQAMLQALAYAKSFVFIGFGGGLGDPNFDALRRWMGHVLSDSRYRHFRLVRRTEVAATASQHDPSEQIVTIPYGENYEELVPFLHSLLEKPLSAPKHTSWVTLGGFAWPGNPAVRQGADGSLMVFMRGQDGELYYRSQRGPNGEWGPEWEKLGGYQWPGNPAVGQGADGRVMVFMRGQDGELYYKSQLGPNGEWGPEWENLGGFAWRGDPAVGQGADNRVTVFMRGADGELYYKTQLAPNGEWGPEWEKLGGFQWPGDPAVGQGADRRLMVFMRGADGELYYKTQLGPNGEWGPEWEHLGGFAWPGDPAVGRAADGRVTVFMRGEDGKLYRKSRQAADGEWEPEWAALEGAAGGDPAVGHSADGRVTVFMRGPDGKLYALRLPP
jgi:hypothetical protein